MGLDLTLSYRGWHLDPQVVIELTKIMLIGPQGVCGRLHVDASLPFELRLPS
jgi:hypothetical protein